MKVPTLALAALISLPLQQSAPPQPAQPQSRPTCTGAEHRQFDFWIGDWQVTVANKPAGTNRIESAQSGCVLIEHWTGAGGGTGTSFNFYDRRTTQWHQLWIDNAGNVLRLSGGLKDGAMIMQSAAGPTPLHRITWTPQTAGTVRQHWETSADQGKTWTTSFDGIYKK